MYREIAYIGSTTSDSLREMFKKLRTFENFVYRLNVYRINKFPLGKIFGQAATLGQYIPFRVYRSQGTLPEGDFRYTTILAGCCRLWRRAANAQARCHGPGWSQRDACALQKNIWKRCSVALSSQFCLPPSTHVGASSVFKKNGSRYSI